MLGQSAGWGCRHCAAEPAAIEFRHLSTPSCDPRRDRGGGV